MKRWRAADLFRGAGYALLVDLVCLGLFGLMHSGGLMWAPVVVWAMAALAITGISIAEERFLMAGGFWLLQLGVFTLFLAGFLKLLSWLPSAARA